MREYTIGLLRPEYAVIRDATNVEVSNPLLGYVGENESTRLTIELPRTGSFYLDWNIGGEWLDGDTAYSGPRIVYIVPGELLEAGDVYLRIRGEDGDTVMYCDPIKFVVKP